jgi:arsenate reductase
MMILLNPEYTEIAEILAVQALLSTMGRKDVVLNKISSMKPRILVLCTANKCRSQITEGYLRHFAGDRAEIYSAGLDASEVHPRAIATMAADGIDISGHSSNGLDQYRGMDFDFVLTVCDMSREQCPWFPSDAVHLHEDFPDPSIVTGTEEEIQAAFAASRDRIREYCRNFVAERLG